MPKSALELWVRNFRPLFSIKLAEFLIDGHGKLFLHDILCPDNSFGLSTYARQIRTFLIDFDFKLPNWEYFLTIEIHNSLCQIQIASVEWADIVRKVERI